MELSFHLLRFSLRSFIYICGFFCPLFFFPRPLFFCFYILVITGLDYSSDRLEEEELNKGCL